MFTNSKSVIRNPKLRLSLVMVIVAAVAVAFNRYEDSVSAARSIRSISSPGPAALLPKTFVVDVTNDLAVANGCVIGPECSLREAIIEANANPGFDTIDATGVTGTINLTRALPNITEGVRIIGPDASLLTVRRDSGGDYRIFTVVTDSAQETVFAGLTIANGLGPFLSLSAR